MMYLFLSLLLGGIFFHNCHANQHRIEEQCGTGECQADQDCCLSDPSEKVPPLCCQDYECCNDRVDEHDRCCSISTECRVNGDYSTNLCGDSIEPDGSVGWSKREELVDPNAWNFHPIRQCVVDTGPLPHDIPDPVITIKGLYVGDGTLIQCHSSEEFMIVDLGCSPSEGSKIWSWEQLQKEVFASGYKLSTVVITHSHTDHYSYIPDVLRDNISDIDNVYIGGQLEEYTSTEIRKWLEEVKYEKKLHVLNNGDPCFLEECLADPVIFTCNGEDTVEVLAANLGTGNKESIVLKVQTGNDKFTAVLMGDMEGSAQTHQLVDNVGERITNISVYKMSHHGSYQSSPAANLPFLLEVVNPEMSYSSNSHDNGYGHARCAVSYLLQSQRGSRILTTGDGEGNFEKLDYSCYLDYLLNHDFDEWLYHIYTTSPRENVQQNIVFEADNQKYGVYTEIVHPENFLNEKETIEFLEWWDFKR